MHWLLKPNEFGYAERMGNCSDIASHGYPCVLPAGDSAALIQFGDELDFTVNAAVLEFDDHLSNAAIAGITEVSPALVSLLVRFDPLQCTYTELSNQLKQALDSKNWLQKPEIKNPLRWKLSLIHI